MIEFPCKCGHQFAVEDDQAGLMIQCPKCGLLSDIPTLDDLRHLAQDGTFEIGDVVEPHDQAEQRFTDQTRAFTRQTFDENGREIDNREHFGDVDNPEPIQLTDEHLKAPQPQFVAPRYDPITGEMIRDVDVDKGPISTPPIPRGKLFRRPRRHDAFEPLPSVAVFGIFARMCHWVNLLVMGIVFFGHIAYMLTYIIGCVVGMLMVLPGTVFMFVAIIGHYGNVIDETGPSCRDELPRPLRDFRFYDDMLQPFLQIALAWILCFGPAVTLFVQFFRTNPQLAKGLYWGFEAIGAVFFPAVLLTLTTSGSFANLRPDRLIGVIARCGPLYLWMILTVSGGFMIYADSVRWFIESFAYLVSGRFRGAPWHEQLYFTTPLLMATIFVAHYASWMLGQVYRVHQPSFPWINQGRRADGIIPGITPARGFEVVTHPKHQRRSAKAPSAPQT